MLYKCLILVGKSTGMEFVFFSMAFERLCLLYMTRFLSGEYLRDRMFIRVSWRLARMFSYALCVVNRE